MNFVADISIVARLFNMEPGKKWNRKKGIEERDEGRTYGIKGSRKGHWDRK